MKNVDNKAFKIIVLTGSTVIVLAVLALISGPQLNVGKMHKLVTLDMVGQDEAAYGYATTGSAPMAYDGDMRESLVAMDGYSKIGMPYPAPSTGGQTAAEAEQRIIKTADLAIAVDGVESKTQAVISIATGRGGFVQSSTIIEDEAGYKSGYVTVRVPSETFEASVQAIKDLAVRVDRESVNGQDVTEQYTDTEARLRSAKAQEEQYLLILDKAETVQDILSVQSYLQNIRYEIESLQGQLDSLGNQTAYSTISVTLQEEVKLQLPTEEFDLVRDVKLALKYVVVLAQAALTVLVWLIIVGGAVLIPLGLLVGIMVWAIRKVIARL